MHLYQTAGDGATPTFSLPTCTKWRGGKFMVSVGGLTQIYLLDYTWARVNGIDQITFLGTPPPAPVAPRTLNIQVWK